jgi:hypothetical protein
MICSWLALSAAALFLFPFSTPHESERKLAPKMLLCFAPFCVIFHFFFEYPRKIQMEANGRENNKKQMPRMQKVFSGNDEMG